MKKLTMLLLLFGVAVLMATPTEFSLVSPANSSEDVDIWPMLEWEESTDETSVTYYEVAWKRP